MLSYCFLGTRTVAVAPLMLPRALTLGPLVIVLQVHSAWSRLDAQSTDRLSRCMVVVVCNGVLGGVVPTLGNVKTHVMETLLPPVDTISRVTDFSS